MIQALREKFKPWHLGFAIGALTLAVLLIGWFGCGQAGLELALLAMIALANGLGAYFLVRSQLRAWLTVLLIGWFIGLESAVELFMETPFEQQCLVALATAVFWMILALFIGALAELIRSLHNASHRAAAGLEERLKEFADRIAGRE